jgi:hypothetical protein
VWQWYGVPFDRLEHLRYSDWAAMCRNAEVMERRRHNGA